MTAETDLLPLPKASKMHDIPGYDEEELKNYALANVAHATATLQAEVEALRAEVEAWRELSDHVRVGACKAIWPDRYVDERIRDVAAALKRAERLADALREVMLWIENWSPPFTEDDEWPDTEAKAQAALHPAAAQESNDA